MNKSKKIYAKYYRETLETSIFIVKLSFVFLSSVRTGNTKYQITPYDIYLIDSL